MAPLRSESCRDASERARTRESGSRRSRRVGHDPSRSRAYKAHGVERSSRRVWGQRPGQPDGSPCVLAQGREATMQVIVKGRNTHVSSHLKELATTKLEKVERFM